MSPLRRRKFFSWASPDVIAELTLPCMGKAHELGGDRSHCELCENVRWGRMLKRDEEVQVDSDQG